MDINKLPPDNPVLIRSYNEAFNLDEAITRYLSYLKDMNKMNYNQKQIDTVTKMLVEILNCWYLENKIKFDNEINYYLNKNSNIKNYHNKVLNIFKNQM